jgi:hypothetical protein
MNGAVDFLTKSGVRRIGPAAGAATDVYEDKKPRTLKDKRGDFKKRAEYLNNLRDPNKMAAELETRFGYDPNAPKVSAAVAGQFTKTAQFLADKLPIDPLASQMINYKNSKWEPSDFELSKFERYVSAAENPAKVFDDMARGRISPEAVETLKELHPIAFERLQAKVLDAIMEPNASLTYAQRVHIGTIFDVPTDPTMAPTFIASMQAQFQEDGSSSMSGDPATSAGPQPKRTIQIHLDPKAMETEAARITYS